MPKAKTAKRKTTTKRTLAKRTKKRTTRDASGGGDKKSARKFRKGGRVEAYTWGEVSGKRDSNWPF